MSVREVRPQRGVTWRAGLGTIRLASSMARQIPRRGANGSLGTLTMTASPSTPTLTLTLSLLSLSMLGTLACDPSQGSAEGTAANNEAQEAAHEQPCVDPDRATPPSVEMCPPERQIAHLPLLPKCPLPGPGWEVEELFAESTPDAMDNYCRYLWAGPGPANLGNLPAGITTTADCRVVAQSPLAPELGQSYLDAFTAGVALVPDASASLGVGYPIDVAVVDTAPANTGKGQAEHGPTIAAIVATVASGCLPALDNRECQRVVSTRLGLPQTVEDGPNPERGGYFGYQSDLAQGIVAAVEGWTNHDHRLILNLSVGWEPSTGDLDSNGVAPTAAIAAVEHAIALARCQGALVIAASGNRPVGSCVDQPTGPGSWEQQPVPSAMQCNDLGFSLASSSASYQPLVHAATPLDWRGRNLADFRPGSDARMATLGFAGVGRVAQADHGPLTGSSVASATLSGIAALVWSYFPGLDADEVMDVIHASGSLRMLDGQSVTADFALAGAGTPEQRVITACGALLHACDLYVRTPSTQITSLNMNQCNAAKLACESSYTSDPSELEAVWWQSFEQALAGLDAMEVGETPLWDEQDCDLCGASEVAYLPSWPALPAIAMPDPWTLPQPEKPPCPMCEIKDEDIYLSLAPDYVGLPLQNVQVNIYDAVGNSERLDYGPLRLSDTTVTVFVDPELTSVGAGGAPVSALVTMVFLDPSGRPISVGNQVPVGP